MLKFLYFFLQSHQSPSLNLKSLCDTNSNNSSLSDNNNQLSGINSDAEPLPLTVNDSLSNISKLSFENRNSSPPIKRRRKHSQSDPSSPHILPGSNGSSNPPEDSAHNLLKISTFSSLPPSRIPSSSPNDPKHPLKVSLLRYIYMLLF